MYAITPAFAPNSPRLPVSSPPPRNDAIGADAAICAGVGDGECSNEVLDTVRARALCRALYKAVSELCHDTVCVSRNDGWMRALGPIGFRGQFVQGSILVIVAATEWLVFVSTCDPGRFIPRSSLAMQFLDLRCSQAKSFLSY